MIYGMQLFHIAFVVWYMFYGCMEIAAILWKALYYIPRILVSPRPSVCPTCRIHSVTPRVLDKFFSYYTQMITSIKGCVSYNDLWNWPMPSRSIRHDFAMKLLKKFTFCRCPLYSPCNSGSIISRFGWIFWMDLFSHLVKIITSKRGCIDRSKVNVIRVVWLFAVGPEGILVDYRSTNSCFFTFSL